MLPRERLETTIRETDATITQYEDILRLSNDPLEQARANRNMNEQKKILNEQLRKYFNLCRDGGAAQDIIDIATILGMDIPAGIQASPQQAAQDPTPSTRPETEPEKKEPPQCAELEITLSPRQENQYAVDMSFRLPTDNASKNPMPASPSPVVVQFDTDKLWELRAKPQEYGTHLTDSLFQHHAAQTGFDRARDRAHSQNPPVPLRVRLQIALDARELHALYWETLRDPFNHDQRLINVQTFFSRQILSNKPQPVLRRPQKEISALVVVANPPYLQHSDFGPINVERERTVVEQGLGKNIRKTILTDSGESSLENIRRRLRRDSYNHDILYLVAHGSIDGKTPYIMLDSPDEQPVEGKQFVEWVTDIEHPPLLVVLASCQSAVTHTNSAAKASNTTLPFTSIGPLLADRGIPAVVAMQGAISQETSQQFTQSFFDELQVHGIIDLAITEARRMVEHRIDWWMPALFMQLNDGRLWE